MKFFFLSITFASMVLLCSCTVKPQQEKIEKAVLIDNRDGKEYRTAKIGEQVWMAENLNYDAKGSLCFKNNPDNCVKYGRLYDWKTAMAIKICPDGWHLPSDDEWDKLYRFVDGDTSTGSPYGSKTAGKHLKAVSGWEPYEGIEKFDNLDTYGFSALPGGISREGEHFFGTGDYGYWWSTNDAYRTMSYSGDFAGWGEYDITSFFIPVRCIQGSDEKSSSSIPSSSSSVVCTDSYGSVHYEGQTYKTVKIGERVWMAENLNYDAEGSVCYDNNPDNCAKYGRLYTWETAMTVCPSCWHLPSKEEWDVLDDDAKKLKARSGWYNNGNGTDDYGFSALPGGYMFPEGSFHDVGSIGVWMSDSEYRGIYVYGRNMYYNSDSAKWHGNYKNLLISVRCIQDSSEKSSSSVPSSSSSVPRSSSSIPSSSSSVGYAGSYGSIHYEGQTYKTVKIGEQVWMAENLNYDAKGSLCFKNNPDNCVKYGRLYDWKTALKVCPKGWHLPSNEDWDKLLHFIDSNTGSENPYESETAGNHLKATSGWKSDGNGTDNYGFSALPGGSRIYKDDFGDTGYRGTWWSANKYNERLAYFLSIYYDSNFAHLGGDYMSFLRSVRCIQD
ncbi:MAG: hypothetical protein LBQ87_09305 [Candidatus Fibromonas sp.]|jgi:uncharacterized protein (TIGR02145 family)|nr:hypothetical protein [Candidatus Fibromonas sp.]